MDSYQCWWSQHSDAGSIPCGVGQPVGYYWSMARLVHARVPSNSLHIMALVCKKFNSSDTLANMILDAIIIILIIT